MFVTLRSCRSPTSYTSSLIWADNLKEVLHNRFAEGCFVAPGTKTQVLPIARFVTILYELKVLSREEWPTARIVEDMHQRGYARDVFTKTSYGAERPPALTEDECRKWMAYYRVRTLNRE